MRRGVAARAPCRPKRLIPRPPGPQPESIRHPISNMMKSGALAKAAKAASQAAPARVGLGGGAVTPRTGLIGSLMKKRMGRLTAH